GRTRAQGVGLYPARLRQPGRPEPATLFGVDRRAAGGRWHAGRRTQPAGAGPLGGRAGVWMTALPRVCATVLAAAVDALPNRLRKKLDDTVVTAASWPVTVHDGQFTVAVDDATTVTLVPVDGTIS